MKKSHIHFICLSFLSLLALPLAAEMTKQQLFFEQHCTDCHGDGTTKGNFDLTALQMDFTNPDNLEKWKLVYDRMEAGEMPPKKKARPAQADLVDSLGTLGKQLTEAENKSMSANAGRASVRRMNREEYQATLRDLLSLPLLNLTGLLPEDGQKHGFDKVAGALDISHIHMTKYLQTADVALRQAIIPATEKPETKTWRESAVMQGTVRSAIAVHGAVPINGLKVAPGLSTRLNGDQNAEPENSYRSADFQGDADSAVVFTGVIGAHQPEGIQPDRFNPPVAGFYNVKFSTWGLRWERTQAVPAVRGLVGNYQAFDKPYFLNAAGQWEGTPITAEKPDMHSWTQSEDFYGKAEMTQIIRASLNGVAIGFYDAPSMKPTVHEFKVWLRPSERISFHAMTLPASGPHNWPSSNGAVGYVGPGVAYDWFEITGPLIDQWPPASQQALFGEKPVSETIPDMERVKMMEAFATRAFRRPLSPGEISPYTDIVEAEIKRGSKFEEAMIAGYKAILCSPDFLFIGLESGIPEPAKKKKVFKGDYAIASRLSYFLWNSMPDQTLLDLAANGRLNQQGTLKGQVERMLLDKRSDRFVDHFTNEWLELKKIAFTTPDPNLYPEFDPWLQDSMLAETRGTFRRMIMQNRGVREIAASDSILINQRLAELYGIKGVLGADLREVKIPADSPRGGFLTQAAVLKVTANGTTTSPILRGVWVMERILGIPRSPVPDNIPAIEPDASGATSMRQIIEKHRADTACASCHAKMDPHGFALEKFDVIGGYRDRYRLLGQAKPEQPVLKVDTETSSYTHVYHFPLSDEIDASGVLTNGQTFTGLNDYRKLLTDQEDMLARNVARQLVIYSTGAGIRFSDRPAINAIIAKTKPTHHGMRSLIQEVVASPLFLSK